MSLEHYQNADSNYPPGFEDEGIKHKNGGKKREQNEQILTTEEYNRIIAYKKENGIKFYDSNR